MEISKAAAGILAAACLTTGAGAAWLMTRGDAPDVVPAVDATVSPDPAAGAPAAVEQSEAIVSEPEPRAPARVREPAVSRPRRAEAPARATARPAPVREPAARGAEGDPAPAPAPAPPAVAQVPPATPATAPVVEAAPTTDSFDSAQDRPFDSAQAEVEREPLTEELIVSADSVIGLQVESTLTSERARMEDEVVARVTRDVRVGDRVAIPAGAQAIGEVTLVERGGKMRDKARLGVRFTSIVLGDGTRIPVETDTVIREGSSPGNESAAKIGGGAIGGAIIGGILGGAKGAIIGGSAGAGAGTAAVMAGGRNPATLAAGAPVTVRLLKAATVTVEK